MTDTIDYLELTYRTVNLMMAFFYVVAVVASLLCFFMLFTTFEANVRAATKCSRAAFVCQSRLVKVARPPMRRSLHAHHYLL